MHAPHVPAAPRRRALHRLLGLAAAPWAAAGTTQAATAVPAFTAAGIVLLQDGALLRERLGDIDQLHLYLDALGEAAGQALAPLFPGRPAGGFVVVALRPGGARRLWLDFEPELPPALQARLQPALASVAPPPVRDGLVVAALQASLWRGRLPTRPAPAPTEWREAAARQAERLEVAALVDRVWPP
ncbi:hypothetical protein [Ideonella livida]|uniref:DUF2066 domain-containing protein n=1 Tax=Ideonella livida TaxID=2707176 RepID=A0A7C9PKB2_9BURK|nr:hypothetical protein [Ideonella livida]NDY93152.1 hypothetical protein [Ideonella livida]